MKNENIEDKIAPISLEISEQMKDLIDFHNYQYEKLMDWINENVGISEKQQGEPQERHFQDLRSDYQKKLNQKTNQ